MIQTVRSVLAAVRGNEGAAAAGVPAEPDAPGLGEGSGVGGLNKGWASLQLRQKKAHLKLHFHCVARCGKLLPQTLQKLTLRCCWALERSLLQVQARSSWLGCSRRGG